MQKKVLNALRNPFSLLKFSFITLFSNPAIFYPFVILAFIQLLVLEIIYFAPRYPLVNFFGPMIAKLDGPMYLHYPGNYFLLTKWFHNMQMFFYIFLSSLVLGTVAWSVYLVNNGKSVEPGKTFARVIKSYIPLILAAILSIAVLKGISFGYGLILKRALLIHSKTGLFFMIKQTVLLTEPFVSLSLACFVSALFAFMIPAIVVDNARFFSAVRINFSKIGPAFLTLLGVALISGMAYFPVLILESTNLLEKTFSIPELRGVLAIFGIFIMLFIDVLQYTAFTIYYLAKKESL